MPVDTNSTHSPESSLSDEPDILLIQDAFTPAPALPDDPLLLLLLKDDGWSSISTANSNGTSALPQVVLEAHKFGGSQGGSQGVNAPHPLGKPTNYAVPPEDVPTMANVPHTPPLPIDWASAAEANFLESLPPLSDAPIEALAKVADTWVVSNDGNASSAGDSGMHMNGLNGQDNTPRGNANGCLQEQGGFATPNPLDHFQTEYTTTYDAHAAHPIAAMPPTHVHLANTGALTTFQGVPTQSPGIFASAHDAVMWSTPSYHFNATGMCSTPHNGNWGIGAGFASPPVPSSSSSGYDSSSEDSFHGFGQPSTQSSSSPPATSLKKMSRTRPSSSSSSAAFSFDSSGLDRTYLKKFIRKEGSKHLCAFPNCPECGTQPKSFHRNRAAETHIRKMLGIKIKCPHCPKTFGAKDQLTRHVKVHDPTATKHRCMACDASFYRKDELKRHQESCSKAAVA